MTRTKFGLFLLAFLLGALSVAAQTTTVSGTITDANAQAFANGTYRIEFNTNGSVPPFTQGGTPFNTSQVFAGALDATGSFAGVAVPSSNTIAPPGTNWKFTVCPGATAPCTVTSIVVQGATLSVSALISPPAITVSASANNQPLAYADAEITGATVGFTYFNSVLGSLRICTTSGPAPSGCSVWASATGGTSVIPSSQPQFAQYIVYPSSTANCLTPSTTGTTFCARNNSTGVVDFSGTDASALVNSMEAALSTTCGTIYFKIGDYLFNTVTQETTGGFTNFYNVGIPPNAGSANQYCQWLFIGEQGPREVGTAAQSQGTIFDVTSTALTSAGAGNLVTAWWARPDVTNSVGAHVRFENIITRFPSTQRQHEHVYDMQTADEVSWTNTRAGIAVNPGSPISPLIALPLADTIGYITPTQGKDNVVFDWTWVEGYNIGYDLETEHITGRTMTGFLCNDFGFIGRITTPPINYNIYLQNIVDTGNVHGMQWGSQLQTGQHTDIIGYNMEVNTSGTFQRLSNLDDNSGGEATGYISYVYGIAGTGLGSQPPNIFSTGGAGFTVVPGSGNPFIATGPYGDNFSHPNSNVDMFGWQDGSATGYAATMQYSSGAAACSANFLCGVRLARNNITNAQFSVTTVGSMTNNGAVGAATNMQDITTARTLYKYIGSTTTGLVTTRSIYKVVANAATLLASVPGTSGVGAGDKMELWHFDNGQLVAYYTPSGGKRIQDLSVNDTAITGGTPGMEINGTTAQATLSNWNGGALPLLNQVSPSVGSSIYDTPPPFVAYATQSNCNVNSVSPAACGSAASGVVVVPTTTTTYTVNSTAVTGLSRIFALPITDNSGVSGAPTCNAPPTPFIGYESARVAGTSFTLTVPSTTGTSCWIYWIIN